MTITQIILCIVFAPIAIPYYLLVSAIETGTIRAMNPKPIETGLSYIHITGIVFFFFICALIIF